MQGTACVATKAYVCFVHLVEAGYHDVAYVAFRLFFKYYYHRY